MQRWFLSLILLIGQTPACMLYSNTNSIWQSVKQLITLDSVAFDEKEQWFSSGEISELDPHSIAWVKTLLRDVPELNWYANDQVRCNYDIRPNQPPFCWSKTIFGHHYPEFDRAVLSVWCLRAFYDGSKESWRHFINPQPAKNALKWETFQEIHHELIKFVENHPWMSKEQVLQSMEVYLILADAGKTPYAQKRAREYRVFIRDTKDFFQKTLERCPNLYPSLKKLSYPCVELLRRTAYPINLNRMRHLEGHAGMIRRLIDSKLLQNEPLDFEFLYLVDLCDSAAFLGQKTVDGSLFLTESMYLVNCQAKNACLQTRETDEYSAYMSYLAQRGQLFNFDIESKQERVLTRIAAMLRLNEPSQGPMLKKAFAKLNVVQQALILSQLDIRRNHDPLRRTPGYIPALLNNLLENEKLGTTFQERLDKTLVLGLPFVAQVLKKHRHSLSMARSDSHIPLNLNDLALKVIENPYILNHVRFRIAENNTVHIE